MQPLEVCRQVLESFLATPVCILQPDSWDFPLFERCHCLDASLQPHFTARHMQKLCTRLQQDVIYVLREPLGMELVMFHLSQSVVMVGPYTPTHWDQPAAEARLSELGISASYLNAYKLYKCQYSVLDLNTVTRAIIAMIELEGGSFSDYVLQILRPENGKSVRPIQIAEAYTPEFVEKTYALETAFQNALRQGDAEKAIGISREMSALNTPTAAVIRGVEQSGAVGASIMRTMARLAAKDAGLPPIVINAIGQDYLQRLSSMGRNQNLQKISELTQGIIHDLCREIRKMKAQNYSALVRKAVDYINFNLGHELSVAHIAEMAGVSAGSLSKHFKQETGMTVSRYVMRQRSRKAAELLASTQHPIQEISNYVGYADSNYFVKVFKAEFNQTPSEYRLKHKL